MEQFNKQPAGPILPVGPANLKIPTTTKYGEAAQEWFGFGFPVIPILAQEKVTALKWDPWLMSLSHERIRAHWTSNPKHELGFIVGDNVLVLDADSPQSIAALAQIEKAFDVLPNLVVRTRKGQHHYFKIAQGAYAKTDSHSTELHPHRIDVKARRSMVILPPSTGKEELLHEAENVDDLVEVGQGFIDAVFRHNGREPPRRIEVVPLSVMPKEVSTQTVHDIKAMLASIDPDCGREDWIHIGMAIKFETNGSDEGFAIWDAWSGEGRKYPGTSELRKQWLSFRIDLSRPITIATIRRLVEDRGLDWREICVIAEDGGFKRCAPSPDTSLATQVQGSHVGTMKINPLDKYSLRGMSEVLEREAVEQVPILGQLVLKGQFTTIYAAPNTGKTLITLSLLLDGINRKVINPNKLYYLNMDDHSSGLITKLKLADEYGFHMMAEGHRSFRVSEFLSLLNELIDTDQCREIIIVLDTLKKFTNLMDKANSTSFTKVIRRFVVKGGSVIALAHTNKKLGLDGKPVYGGTTDIVDDADCVYTLAVASSSEETGEKIVEFENIKRRGNVDQTAAYAYKPEKNISYDELLLSVRSVDPLQLISCRQTEQIKADSVVISAILECIRSGINTKMKLAAAAAAKAEVSQNSALRLIEKYIGNDPNLHRWKFVVRDRGAKVFEVLDSIKPEFSGS